MCEVVSANKSFFTQKDKAIHRFHLQSSVLTKGLRAKFKGSLPWVYEGPRSTVYVTGFRSRWRAQGQRLNSSPSSQESAFLFVQTRSSSPRKPLQTLLSFCNRQHKSSSFKTHQLSLYSSPTSAHTGARSAPSGISPVSGVGKREQRKVLQLGEAKG